MAALTRSGRVRSINLTITSSPLPKFLTIEEPFTELDELVLLSRDSVQLTIPSTFRWGPRLRRLHSTRISFPSLPQLLCSSRDLVDLQLNEIPSIGYLSPKAFANALSATTQLQFLSLHFLSPTSRPSHIGIYPSPGERVVLPALSRLKFRGTSEYLNNLVTRINAPHLEYIEVGFFNQLVFNISQLVSFINQIESQRSHRQAEIRSSLHAISLTFTSPGTHPRFTLQVSCEDLDWQLSSMAQICDQFSTSGFLFGVTDLLINTTQPSSGQDDADSEHWPELIHSFTSIEWFSLAGGFMTNILRASQAAEWENNPLPALKFLSIAGVASCDLLAAIRSFVTPLQASGRLVQVHHIDTGSRETKILIMKEEHEGGCELCGSSECPDAFGLGRGMEIFSDWT